MGDFSEHVLFGFLTAVIVSFMVKEVVQLNILESISSVTFVFLGSILPDVDHKKSYIHRSVKSVISITSGSIAFFLPISMYQKYLGFFAVSLTIYWAIGKMKITHRGFTHSLSFLAITTSSMIILTIFFLNSFIPGLAFGVGLLSHLILDGEFKIE